MEKLPEIMTDKERHIQYWASTALDDIDAIDYLFAGGKYIQALYFAHLSLEKVLKAHWVKDNEQNIPPRTHNLIYLLERTNLELIEDDSDFLQMMNIYQIEGRYPSYMTYLHQNVAQEETADILSQAKQLFICLQERLQSIQ